MGTFKNVNDTGNRNPTEWSLKKFTSSIILNMIPSAKKAKVTLNMTLEYSIKKYFANIFNLNIYQFRFSNLNNLIKFR